MSVTATSIRTAARVDRFTYAIRNIVAEAKKAADEEKVRARHEIGLARDEALSSIAEKAGDLAVEVAGKFLRDKIGKDDHARLVKDSVASLGKAKPSVN